MEKTISATEARVHFGELMRRVVEDHQTTIVERDGKPQIVLLSIVEYERLKKRQKMDKQLAVLNRLGDLRQGIMIRRKGEPLPPAEEVIQQMREERDEQLIVDLC